jgi:hypothetical protein
MLKVALWYVHHIMQKNIFFNTVCNQLLKRMIYNYEYKLKIILKTLQS